MHFRDQVSHPNDVNVQACAQGDGFGNEMDATVALRAGVEAEGAEANAFVVAFYAALAPMQVRPLPLQCL